MILVSEIWCSSVLFMLRNNSEEGEEHIRNSLQNIFRVQLPGASQIQSGFLILPDVTEVYTGSDARQTVPSEKNVNHSEMIQDIIMEVLVMTAESGKQKAFVCLKRLSDNKTLGG